MEYLKTIKIDDGRFIAIVKFPQERCVKLGGSVAWLALQRGTLLNVTRESGHIQYIAQFVSEEDLEKFSSEIEDLGI